MPKQNSNIKEINVKGFKIFFNPDSHRFWRIGEDGKKISIPSVTSFTGIIDKSQFLIPWAVELFTDYLMGKIANKEAITEVDVYDGSQQHRIKKEEGGDVGSQAHEWVSLWLKGENPTIPDNIAVQQVIKSFLDYQEEHNLNWICSEEIIYYNDGEMEYAGILDAIAKRNGKTVLIDFKSSNTIYTDYYFQLAAYQLAYEWMHDEVIDYRMILRFAKETEDEYIIRMEEKNRKAREKGKTGFEYPKWVPVEPRELHDNLADKLAFKACVTLKNRIKEVENGNKS